MTIRTSAKTISPTKFRCASSATLRPTQTHMRIYQHARKHVNTRIHMHAYIHIYVHMHTNMHTCTSTDIYTCTRLTSHCTCPDAQTHTHLEIQNVDLGWRYFAHILDDHEYAARIQVCVHHAPNHIARALFGKTHSCGTILLCVAPHLRSATLLLSAGSALVRLDLPRRTSTLELSNCLFH